jgi:hypothetical protein
MEDMYYINLAAVKDQWRASSNSIRIVLVS